MQRLITDRSRGVRFNPLLQTENLILGVILLIMTAAFTLKAMLF